MVSMDYQAAMGITITTKNTFVDIKTPKACALRRRSNSVPRAFKLGESFEIDYPETDASTSASDKDVPDHRSEFTDGSPSECSDENKSLLNLTDMLPEGADASESSKSKSTLSLAEMVIEGEDQDDSPNNKVKLSLVDTVKEESRRKLRPSARPFMSARTPPNEVLALIANTVEVLSSAQHIVDVQVQDGGMGGTTMIAAKSSSTSPDSQLIFSMVKDAILNSASQSENTYVLGYGAQPFKNLDELSFSMSIACVPAAHQETACWDFYEKGFCHRCATCRWDHPSDTDTMRMIVLINRHD